MSEYRWEGRTAEQWRQQLQVPAVHLYDVIDSTNQAALALAEQGAPSLTLVVADYQTSGRGRAGRSWFARPGASLLFSLVFRTPARQQYPGAAPVRVGLAVADAIEPLTPHPVMIKWPNDLIVAGAGKVAGILCEGVVRQQGHAYIVAGVGINVLSTGSDFVALADLGGVPRRGDLLTSIVQRLQPLSDQLIDPLTDEERNALRPRDLLFGEMVENEDGLTGRACGVARDGSLLVETPRGVRAVQSATIRLAETGAYPGSTS